MEDIIIKTMASFIDHINKYVIEKADDNYICFRKDSPLTIYEIVFDIPCDTPKRLFYSYITGNIIVTVFDKAIYISESEEEYVNDLEEIIESDEFKDLLEKYITVVKEPIK